MKNGKRYEILSQHAAVLESIALAGIAHCELPQVQSERLLRELLNLQIVSKGPAVNGSGKFIANDFVSSSCLSFPRTVYLECTRRCNLRCVHCYSSSGSNCHDELPIEIGEKLVEELGLRGAEFLSIGGGEPLMYKGLFRLIELCHQHEVEVEVTTNGQLLSKEAVRKLSRAGLRYLQVSVDGASTRTYEDVRRGGSFRRLQDVLSTLKERFVLSICTVALASNIEEIPAVIDLAIECGAKHFRVLPLMDLGRASDEAVLGPTSGQLKELHEYIGQRQKVERRINIQFNENLILPNRKNIAWMPEDQYGCSAGRSTCGIDANGNVFPCSYLQDPTLACGSIAQSSLSEIWAHSRVLRSVRELSRPEGRCSSCEHLNTCRGGCRAAAYLQNGNLRASDPLCTVGL